MSICQCCGNKVHATSGITMYWLVGRNYIWSVCYDCWANEWLKALFLNQKQDIPENLVKKFGLSLGYPEEEIRLLN